MSLKDTSNVANFSNNSFAFYPINLKNTLNSLNQGNNNKQAIAKLFTEVKVQEKLKDENLNTEEQKIIPKKKKKRVMVSYNIEQCYQVTSVVQLFEHLMKTEEIF